MLLRHVGVVARRHRAAEYGLLEYSTVIRFVVAMAEELSIPEYSINEFCIMLFLLP